jgi:hypothetical protein
LPGTYALVADRARHRCEYCGASEAPTNFAFPVDHIVPRSQAPNLLDDLDNLALACPSCNWHKAARTRATDPDTGETVRLFHPRHDSWADHFTWSANATLIVGRTAIGRATVAALQMYAPAQRRARVYWVAAGIFP